ncbi:MAG TPA: hypothetical protein VNW97_20480 [Candidatus Saccharimonadales bacterium]|jgi:hypothetical protein|nr:hypothetical protein [Candidatus Saccharimonadales bacterium]
MKSPHLLLLVLSAVLAGIPCAAWPQAASRPSVTFELFWETATPQSYKITVDESGSARYEAHTPSRPAEGRAVTPSDPDDFEMAFTVSSAARQQIFQLARELEFFNGNWDFKKHEVASTGKKTLTYTGTGRQFHTTYDYSENKAIQKTAAIFQGISLTLEHGRKLQWLYRFDKLGLASELSGMEDMEKNHDLYELQLIAPTLRKIANDPRVLHMARQRAERLLAVSGSSEK